MHSPTVNLFCSLVNLQAVERVRSHTIALIHRSESVSAPAVVCKEQLRWSHRYGLQKSAGGGGGGRRGEGGRGGGRKGGGERGRKGGRREISSQLYTRDAAV